MDLAQLKSIVKRNRAYPHVHVIRRMGVRHWVRRQRIVRRVDRAPALRTKPWAAGQPGVAEVHMLVRSQDIRLAAWSLHSLYAASGVDWPIVFHQGGDMRPSDWAYLRTRFPDAHQLPTAVADAQVEPLLLGRGLRNSVAVRRVGPMLRKLLDPVLLSAATSLLVPDTDVLFFRRPDAILNLAGTADHPHCYNRDRHPFPYNIGTDESVKRFGTAPAPHVNAGLSLLNRARIPLDQVEAFLGDPLVTAAPFFAEQTVHALLAGRNGATLLPDTYACSVAPGLTTPAGEPLVAKHYIETPRPLLFEEGMAELLRRGMVGP